MVYLLIGSKLEADNANSSKRYPNYIKFLSTKYQQLLRRCTMKFWNVIVVFHNVVNEIYILQFLVVCSTALSVPVVRLTTNLHTKSIMTPQDVMRELCLA
jgi:hypothetical protein